MAIYFKLPPLNIPPFASCDAANTFPPAVGRVLDFRRPLQRLSGTRNIG